MNEITDIKPQKNSTRVSIFVDGEYSFGVSQELKIVNKLKIGEIIVPEKIESLIFDDQVERIYEKAIKFLSYRPRSEKEIRDNLLQKLWKTDKGEQEKKNFDKSIDKVLSKLEKIGQVDDVEFARWWFDQRTRFKKTSPRIIKQELFKKGINKEIIEEIFSKNTIDPYNLALDAATKKSRNYEKYDQKTYREKMSRYLASKGFDWEVIKKVVDTLVETE